MKNKPIFFKLFLFFSLLFISTSAYVFLNSNQLLNDLHETVEVITFARVTADRTDNLRLDHDLYSLQGNNERINEFLKFSKPKAEKFELNNLSNLLKKIEGSLLIDATANRAPSLKEALKDTKSYCNGLIVEKRKNASLISMKLDTLWTLAIYLLAAACLLFVYFVFRLYIETVSKQELVDLKNIKSLLLDKSIDVVVTCDNIGRIVEFNPAAEKFFGYPKKEVVKRSISMLYADVGEARKVKESFHFNEIFKGNVRIRRKNGELIYTQLSANIIRNDQGKEIGSMGIARYELLENKIDFKQEKEG